MSSFAATLTAFCDELKHTFPELGSTIARVSTATPTQFWKMWHRNLDILVICDANALFNERKGLIAGAVQLTPALWSEISDKTREAIWRYLRTLVLEAAMENNLENVESAEMQKLIDIMNVERQEETMNHLQPFLERMKGLIGSKFADMSGGFSFPDLSGMSLPEIPERLRNGRIAKLAEEMAKQFDPADFGIDATLLKGDNVEKILAGIAELYQRDPSKLLAGAQRVAEKIKKQIMGGSLNKDELIAEAQEFITLLKEHPMFKEIVDKFSGLTGPGGLAEMFSGLPGFGASASAPSERRRAVQERLRKKMAERTKAKEGGK
jgi:hypothetical protein